MSDEDELEDDEELVMGCDRCDEPITGDDEFERGGLCPKCFAIVHATN